MLSTCAVISLFTHSTQMVPPNSKKAMILPQFTPSLNSSFMTAVKRWCAVMDVRCSCLDISAKSDWYSRSSSSPASRSTVWRALHGSWREPPRSSCLPIISPFETLSSCPSRPTRIPSSRAYGGCTSPLYCGYHTHSPVPSRLVYISLNNFRINAVLWIQAHH